MRDTILPYRVLQCEIFFTGSRKITVQVLEAGCRVFYRKFYGFFLLFTLLANLTCFTPERSLPKYKIFVYIQSQYRH